MTSAAFVILVTLFGSQVEQKTLRCRNWACVQMVEEAAWGSCCVSRVQVWRGEEFARVEGQAIWSPVLDLQYQ